MLRHLPVTFPIKHLGLALGLSVAFLAAVLARTALANDLSTPIDGCALTAAPSIVESQQFTRYGDQQTQPSDRLINGDKAPSTAKQGFAPALLDDSPISFSTSVSSLRMTYYLASPIGADMTYPQFFASGGLLLMTYPEDPLAGPYVAGLKAELGDRVTVVEIGQTDGALTWGDPMSNGLRPHDLSWPAAGTIYRVIADRPADVIINLGRGLVC